MAESESSEALKVKEKELKRQDNGRNDSNLEAEEEEFEEDDGEEEKEEEEEEESQLSELQQLGELQEKEVRGSEVETVAAVALPPSSTAMLSKANDQPVGNSGMEKHVETEFKGQVEGSHQKVVASVAAQSKAETQNHLHSYVCPTTLSELSPTSVTQSISSAPSPTLPEQRMSSPKLKNAGQQSSAQLKPLCVPVVKTSILDGYNWRKYGQKQVKSPKGSRSYYKCTYSDCYAKKIECSDHSGHVIEIVNKGVHSHEKPLKNKSTRENRDASAVRPVLLTTVTEHTVRMLKDSEPATLSKEPMQEATAISERKRQSSSSSDENMEIQIEDHGSEPEPKRRLKAGNLECSKTHLKPGKKPKFVVHAAGDVGISGDGFRWRKYGQKMVKGNPHPRNYYRCTSAGCPVRKHIEIAADNTNAVIITYKGVHDHDMPVPKKRHGQPSAPLVAAAAPASMTSMPLKKSETPKNQVISTQWSVSKEGELTSETLDLGTEKEKAIESARTLLSIGFEIKPC